ncbi:hypothetical protein ACH3O9_10190 [Leeuwenhoekiella sp. A16]|uniref:hypothetical protein n=1 Tax=unclassified Leeuwenhoekiella TaxID=2615029 RepID=UPI003A7FECB4
MEEQMNLEHVPNIDSIKKSIQKFKDCNLSKIGYGKLWQALENEFGIIPFLNREIEKGEIDRARINSKIGEVFNSENEISYREDISNINKYGRTNAPFQSMFYGAIPTSKIGYPRITSLIETSEIFRDIPQNKFIDAHFMMTLGKWEIKKPLKVVDLVFNKNNIENIEDIQFSHEDARKTIAENFPDNTVQIELILEFFSDEFAKIDIKNNNDYKISCIYSQMALNQGVDGIAYPSVRTKAMGYNIALTPLSVDSSLQMTKASMHKIEKENDDTYIGNYKIALDLGDFNSNFKWERAEK